PKCSQGSAVALVVPVVSADVLFRRGQADQRRPYMAQFNSARLPLLHTAAAHADCMVRASRARMVSARLSGVRIHRRIVRSVPDLHAAIVALCRWMPVDL